MNKTTTSPRIEELTKVWAPEALLYVPAHNEKVPFNFPAFGPGNYADVVGQVLANKQRLPTGEQSAFMLDVAYNYADESVKNSPRTKFIREDIMRNGWLWIPVVNIWTPKKDKNPGMYAVFDEKGEGLSRVYNINELEDRLSGGSTERKTRFSEDRKVSFAPLNIIRRGEHDKGTLSQDGAFIANYGVEGAEKLDEVVKFFRYKPHSWIVDNSSDKPIQSLSALLRSRLLYGHRLDAGFDSGGDGGDGYVLSVSGSKSGG